MPGDAPPPDPGPAPDSEATAAERHRWQRIEGGPSRSRAEGTTAGGLSKRQRARPAPPAEASGPSAAGGGAGPRAADGFAGSFTPAASFAAAASAALRSEQEPALDLRDAPAPALPAAAASAAGAAPALPAAAASAAGAPVDLREPAPAEPRPAPVEAEAAVVGATVDGLPRRTPGGAAFPENMPARPGAESAPTTPVTPDEMVALLRGVPPTAAPSLAPPATTPPAIAPPPAAPPRADGPPPPRFPSAPPVVAARAPLGPAPPAAPGPPAAPLPVPPQVEWVPGPEPLPAPEPFTDVAPVSPAEREARARAARRRQRRAVRRTALVSGTVGLLFGIGLTSLAVAKYEDREAASTPTTEVTATSSAPATTPSSSAPPATPTGRYQQLLIALPTHFPLPDGSRALESTGSSNFRAWRSPERTAATEKAVRNGLEAQSVVVTQTKPVGSKGSGNFAFRQYAARVDGGLLLTMTISSTGSGSMVQVLFAPS